MKHYVVHAENLNKTYGKLVCACGYIAEYEPSKYMQAHIEEASAPSAGTTAHLNDGDVIKAKEPLTFTRDVAVPDASPDVPCCCGAVLLVQPTQAQLNAASREGARFEGEVHRWSAPCGDASDAVERCATCARPVYECQRRPGEFCCVDCVCDELRLQADLAGHDVSPAIHAWEAGVEFEATDAEAEAFFDDFAEWVHEKERVTDPSVHMSRARSSDSAPTDEERDPRCPSTFTDRDDEHKLYECHLPRDHEGFHEGCHGAVWSDGLVHVSHDKKPPAAQPLEDPDERCVQCGVHEQFRKLHIVGGGMFCDECDPPATDEKETPS